MTSPAAVMVRSGTDATAGPPMHVAQLSRQPLSHHDCVTAAPRTCIQGLAPLLSCIWQCMRVPQVPASHSVCTKRDAAAARSAQHASAWSLSWQRPRSAPAVPGSRCRSAHAVSALGVVLQCLQSRFIKQRRAQALAHHVHVALHLTRPASRVAAAAAIQPPGWFCRN